MLHHRDPAPEYCLKGFDVFKRLNFWRGFEVYLHLVYFWIFLLFSVGKYSENLMGWRFVVGDRFKCGLIEVNNINTLIVSRRLNIIWKMIASSWRLSVSNKPSVDTPQKGFNSNPNASSEFFYVNKKELSFRFTLYGVSFS